MRCVWLAIAVCCLAASPVLGDDKKPIVGPPAPPAELKVVRAIDTGEEPIRLFAFSPDGRVLATAQGKQVRFWDVANGKEIGHAWDAKEFLDKGTGNILSLAFVDSKTVALSAAPDLVVHLRSYPEGRELARLVMGKNPMTCLAVAPGLVAAGETGGAPHGIRLWSGPVWRQQWRVELPHDPANGPTDSPRTLTFSPDRMELVVATDRGYVHVYRVKDGELLRSADSKKLGHSGGSVAYSPDGREMAIASGSSLPFERSVVYGLGIWDAELKSSRAQVRWGRLAQEEPAHALRCLFSPDGKTLIALCANKTVRFYETETGGLRHVGRVPTWPASMVLSPDGRLLSDRHYEKGRRVISMDWRATTGKPQPLGAAVIDSLWDQLASQDSAKGFRAVVALGAAPSQVANLIGAKLKPVPVPNAAAVKSWVAELGSDDFATREAAEKELARLGDAVEAELREAAKSDVPERRDRAGKLLKAVSRRDSPERLRVLRAVEVLEYTDTPAGREVLKTLAGGAPSALLTRDAKAALARLKAFDPKP